MRERAQPTVCVIGLGLMGTGIAETLSRAKTRVIGWNRTSRDWSKLKEAGVEIRDSLADAVADSDLILAITLNYQSTYDTLPAMGSLSGKDFIQMTTGGPKHAQQLADTMTAQGCRYLDAAMKKVPANIGADQGAMVYSGDRSVFERSVPLLQHLGGRQVFLSENVGAAKAFELATFCRSYPWVFGYFQAMALAREYGIEAAEASSLMLSLIGSSIQYMEKSVPHIASDSYDKAVSASVAVHHAALSEAIAAANEAGLRTPFLDVVRSYMEQTIEAGLGDRDISACYRAVAQDRTH